MDSVAAIVEKLRLTRSLERSEYKTLLASTNAADNATLCEAARSVAESRFRRGIYIRGLVEITNRCRNNCYYCGLRRDNSDVERYALSQDEIVDCCRRGYDMGFRTFVLQGGEGVLSPDFVERTVAQIRSLFGDAAITLSLGESDTEVYRRWFDAGATRYLLRHETANRYHYARLHPTELSFDNRRRCLHALKSIGYQTGAGMMVGSPYQTLDCLVDDLEFLTELQPEMVGVGPFIPQSSTPLAHFAAGSVAMTVRLLAIVRLMLPDANLPATTALATLSERGREQAILAGANVVMPNLSPVAQRAKYQIYDNKKSFNLESAEGLAELEKQLNSIGYHISDSRGDYKQTD